MTMKRFALLVVLLLLALPWVTLGPGGGPLLTWSSGKGPVLVKTQSKYLYRWMDFDGVWHESQVYPEGVNFKTIQIVPRHKASLAPPIQPPALPPELADEHP